MLLISLRLLLSKPTDPFVRPDTLRAWRELFNDYWALSDVSETFRAFFEIGGLELFESGKGTSWAFNRYPKNFMDRNPGRWVRTVDIYNDNESDSMNENMRRMGTFEQMVRNWDAADLCHGF
jgi:hypothetical protein